MTNNMKYFMFGVVASLMLGVIALWPEHTVDSPPTIKHGCLAFSEVFVVIDSNDKISAVPNRLCEHAGYHNTVTTLPDGVRHECLMFDDGTPTGVMLVSYRGHSVPVVSSTCRP